MSQVTQSFQELLRADLENTGQLIVLMDQERQHLEIRDLESMNRLILEKAQVLAKIENNDDLRRSLLQQANFPDSKEGITRYIDTLPESTASACLRDFELLQLELQKCQNINTVNGIITNRSKKRTQQSMDIIRGISGRDTLYTKQGCTNKASNTGSRPISEA